MSVIEDARSWMKSNPKYKEFLNNDEVCLTFYAVKYPKKNIVPDFELQKPKILVDTQIYIPNYDNKIFKFILEKGLANYKGKKFVAFLFFSKSAYNTFTVSNSL